MGFLRHRQISHYDDSGWAQNLLAASSHYNDEFALSYSSASCSSKIRFYHIVMLLVSALQRFRLAEDESNHYTTPSVRKAVFRILEELVPKKAGKDSGEGVRIDMGRPGMD